MNKLPTELILDILENLNCQEKLKICKSNKKMFNICRNDKKISIELVLCYLSIKLRNKEYIHDNLDPEEILKKLEELKKHYTFLNNINIYQDTDLIYKVLLDVFPEYFDFLSEDYPVNLNNKYTKISIYIAKNWRNYKQKLNIDTLLYYIFYYINPHDTVQAYNIKKYISKELLQEIKNTGIDWFNTGQVNRESQIEFFNYLIN